METNMMLDNKLAIASVSLGQHVSHNLPRKILAAAQSGFSGIEITYPDLEIYAKSTCITMLEAAGRIHDICEEQNVIVLAFAPFENFEGNKSPLEERLEIANTWLNIARALGAEYLQVPSTYTRDINNDHELMVSELRQLADLSRASEPVIKIAYENLAWGTCCSLWQDALQIVLQVDRENFGLCLDSFHLSVALWADAFTLSGRQASGDERLENSLCAFVERCPLSKLFYVQLSDGEKLNPPYSEEHPWYDPSLEPGHVWSKEARPFPLEVQYGAYMPVQEISRAVLVEKGFSGWVSLETFDRRMRNETASPEENARRGINAWQALKTSLRVAETSN